MCACVHACMCVCECVQKTLFVVLLFIKHLLSRLKRHEYGSQIIYRHACDIVSAPDHTQAKSGLATRAKFLGPDDVSFWNAGIPIKSVLAQLVTCESHDILSLVPKSGPGTRLS